MSTNKIQSHVNLSISIILVGSLLAGLAFVGGSTTSAQAKTNQVWPPPGQSQSNGFQTLPMAGYPGEKETENALPYRSPTSVQSSLFMADVVNPVNAKQAVSKNMPEDLTVGHGQIQGSKSEAYSGSMPAGVDPNSLPADIITIDMAYDVVMGWVEPGQLVSVTYGSEGYGSAEADGIGFFWTRFWHSTDGHQIGIDYGTPLSITVEGTPIATLTPYQFTDTHLLALEDKISGTLLGASEGVTITASLGEFDVYSGVYPPPQGAPTGSGVTDSSGFFEVTNIGVDLGAESAAALDFEQSGVNIRDYVIPQEVFMVHQMNNILGYTAPGQHVIATVYVGEGPDVRWTGETDATWPFGYYSFSTKTMNYGDLVTVELSGGPTLSTTVASLGDFVFDAEADTLQGQAAEGTPIRTILWQSQGEERNLAEEHATADSAGFFVSFSPVDLKAYNNVLVVATDASGNQTQILSGAAYVDVLQDPLTNQDCVIGRLNAPYVPITVSLDKGGDGSVDYVRETGWVSEAGNGYGVCFLIRDPNFQWGPINIDPGDIATLSNGSDWSESVEAINFDWGWDTATDSISGQDFPEGEMEVVSFQWVSERYPIYGSATYLADITSGAFSASYSNFDIRDGQAISLTHYDLTGNGNTYYPWLIPSLPFFELHLEANTVGGRVGIANDVVTISLFENASATEPLVTTSTDYDPDPYQFWIGDFGGYELLPGMRVAVSSLSGWSAEMIVPAMELNVDYLTNEIRGSGPQGKLLVRAWRDDADFYLFIPTNSSSAVYLLTDNYGHDLHQGDYVSLIYQAPDGNQACQEVRLGDLYLLGDWLNYGQQDWLWGEAIPGSNITISINGGNLIQAYFEDPNCPECWGIHEPQDINPGDQITVSMDTGYSLTYPIPNPLTSLANPVLDTVTGQIGGRVENWVNIETNWDGRKYDVMTDLDGRFTLESTPEMTIDVPPGGEGVIYFNEYHDEVQVDISQHYRTFDLLLNVNYDHDWVEGDYPEGYEVALAVMESDGVTPKATTTLTTGVIPWWDGRSGFSTNMAGVVWDPERPDIQPGDWVYGEVTVDTTTYYAQVHLGTFAGELNADTDTYTGTLSVPWLPQGVPVRIQCHPWGAPGGVSQKEAFASPNGLDEFSCGWPEEWDVQPGQNIAVVYQDPNGHWVYSVPVAYSDELILRTQYDHNWIEGTYRAGHEIFLQVLDEALVEKAHITLTSGFMDGWGSQTGFSTNMEGADWSPNNPDIQPGDTILGMVDGGTFTAQVKIGTITANLDLDADIVNGTVDAGWLVQTGKIRVSCEIWQENSPQNQEYWVLPNGSDTYTCDWTSEDYDLNETSNLMVAYFEPLGHEVIGDFSPPAPRLRIEKWLEGGQPGEEGNVTFSIQYANEGDAPAVNAIITDTFVQGLTYLGDTSGLPKTQVDNQVIWQLGELPPGDWVRFNVFAHVDALESEDIINTATISSDSFDRGNPEERTRTWQGTVIANNTHVNVGKGTWTWNPAAGQDYVYNINVCNNGPTGSSELSLTDTLPQAVTLVSWWGQEAGWTEISVVENVLNLEYPTIPGGSCRQVFVKVNLDPAAQPGDELINIAEISAENDDPNEEDNHAEVHHNVSSPYTELSISLGWHSGSLTPGGQYRLGIYFNNNGNVPIEGPTPITLTLPAGTSFVGWSFWDWASYLGEPVVVGNQVTWLVDDLDAGYYGTIEVTVDIDPGVLPGTELLHSVEIPVQPGEGNLGDNTAMLNETVFAHGPNLRVRKWGDWHGFGEGKNAWYQLSVENIGDQTVEDVVLTDNYPAQMSLDGGVNVNFWEWWTWEDFPAEHYFTVSLDRLEPGWVSGINYNVVNPTSDPVAPGLVFINTASVTEDPEDTNPTDNIATFLLGSGPDMYVEKTLIDGEFHPGEEVTYLLKFGNAQPGHTWWWNMVGNAILTDTLPAGMTFVGAKIHWGEGPQEWSDFLPDVVGQVLTWVPGPFGSSGWNEIMLTVKIDEGAQDGAELINQATITSDQPLVDVDPFHENNASSYTGVVDVVWRLVYLPFIRR